MPNEFCLTDDIIAYLMEHAAEINAWNKGEISFSFRNKRLVLVRPAPELRVGYEIQLESDRAKDHA